MEGKSWKFHVIIMIIVAIPVFFLFQAWLHSNNESNPPYEYKTVTETQPRVYVTKTGEHYHSYSCSYLHSSSIPMGKQQAIDEGYYSCSKCGGRSSGTITVTYKKKVLVNTQAAEFWGPLLLTILTTPMGYLLVYTVIQSRKEDAWIDEIMKKKRQ